MKKTSRPSPFKYCKIFPPIGVARVGNSPEEFFIGPEAPGMVPDAGGTFKDKSGRIKRQAARFRVYAFGDGGKVAELTLDHKDVASIEWKVTLANKKAAWFQFGGADLVADILRGKPSESKILRNPEITGTERDKLVIGPVAATARGASIEPQPLDANFVAPPSEINMPVHLGDLRTDESGRLLVLGGRGDSGTAWPENPVTNYANNNGWYDDVSDGPVEVEVTLKNGEKLPVQGRSWVVVAPPHFSPHTENVVTLHDVLAEIAVAHKLEWPEHELGPKPATDVSFTRDVYPILKRMTDYQWVSARSHRGHSAGKRGDFFSEETIRKLASAAEAKKPGSLHKGIFQRLRTPIIHPPFDASRKPHAGLLDPDSQEAVNQANLTYMP
ncbi:MAG TPA: LodA/GoxA family CTQ-dependent oxidase, partial [Roseimicrobium sp.]|nr:LodA/GoxA family CTQ-dependent oxidase [Roseimicrobium sp.]